MDAERKLPKDILKMATLRGNEYAWASENVLHVIEKAKELNFAVFGGQLQFRLPEETCELYWVDFEIDDKQKSETWKQFVQRAAQECQRRFLAIVGKYDLLREGLESFKVLRERHESGINIMDYACFVIYMVDESDFKEVQANYSTHMDNENGLNKIEE